MFGLYQRSNFSGYHFFFATFLSILGRTAKKCALSSHTSYNCSLFGHWSGHFFLVSSAFYTCSSCSFVVLGVVFSAIST